MTRSLFFTALTHVILVIVFREHAAAATKKQYLVVNSVNELKTQVRFGDATTYINIWKNKSGAAFSTHWPKAVSQTGKLTRRDFEYLRKLALAAHEEKSHEMRFCRRNHIRLIYATGKVRQERIACLSSSLPLTKKLVSFVNAVDLL